MSDLLPLFMCMVPNGHNMVILPLAKSSTWRYFSWSNTVSSGAGHEMVMILNFRSKSYTIAAWVVI